MTNCRECSVTISRSAKSCPRCGAAKPAQGKVQYGLNQFGNFLIIVGVVLTILMILVL